MANVSNYQCRCQNTPAHIPLLSPIHMPRAADGSAFPWLEVEGMVQLVEILQEHTKANANLFRASMLSHLVTTVKTLATISTETRTCGI